MLATTTISPPSRRPRHLARAARLHRAVLFFIGGRGLAALATSARQRARIELCSSSSVDEAYTPMRELPTLTASELLAIEDQAKFKLLEQISLKRKLALGADLLATGCASKAEM